MKFFVPIAATFFALLASAAVAVEEETKTLDELYADAVAEGGNLVMYHGGDTPTQQDRVKNAFIEAFPEINFTMVVDYSKYHDVRIDNQLETDTLVPDVVALQTLQDFTRWTDEGKLLCYKPAGFSQIYDGLKDDTGAWMAYTIFTFGYIYNSSALNGLEAPTSPADLVGPEWAGQIASTYPHDDDAALFVYTRYVEKFGWEWVASMSDQSIDFNRGSNVAGDLVSGGEKTVGLATGGGGDPIQFVGGNGVDYLSWGQRLAILEKAKNPAAAKLFVSWALSEEVQSSVVGETVRTDVNTSSGVHPWEIPEANMEGFATFMEDREQVEMWKSTFVLYFGEVQGAPTPGVLGVHPGL